MAKLRHVSKWMEGWQVTAHNGLFGFIHGTHTSQMADEQSCIPSHLEILRTRTCLLRHQATSPRPSPPPRLHALNALNAHRQSHPLYTSTPNPTHTRPQQQDRHRARAAKKQADLPAIKSTISAAAAHQRGKQGDTEGFDTACWLQLVRAPKRV